MQELQQLLKRATQERTNTKSRRKYGFLLYVFFKFNIRAVVINKKAWPTMSFNFFFLTFGLGKKKNARLSKYKAFLKIHLSFV